MGQINTRTFAKQHLSAHLCFLLRCACVRVCVRVCVCACVAGRQQLYPSRGCIGRNQIRLLFDVSAHNRKKHKEELTFVHSSPRITLALSDCGSPELRKPSQPRRFHSSSDECSCTNPLISVRLADVSMETVFTAPRCSKNGSKVIARRDGDGGDVA